MGLGVIGNSLECSKAPSPSAGVADVHRNAFVTLSHGLEGHVSKIWFTKGLLEADEESGTPCIHLVSVQVFTISALKACILFISKG